MLEVGTKLGIVVVISVGELECSAEGEGVRITFVGLADDTDGTAAVGTGLRAEDGKIDGEVDVNSVGVLVGIREG